MGISSLRLVQALAGARVGGAESFYERLVTAMAGQSGVTQHAVLRDWPERVARLTHAGVDVRCHRFGGRLDLLDHYSYRKTLSELAPDVVLTYMNRASMVTPQGHYTLVSRLGHFYNLKYYRHADFWIGNTRGICDYLVRHGMPADRVVHIANFAREEAAQPLHRQTLGVPDEAPVLLAAGRLHSNKGFDVLLRALRELDGVHLLLAGDGPERAALEALAEAEGVSQRVVFLGWRNDVGALMRSADVFVCPSRHEGLGGVVLEAWFHGCPVVSTRSQGPSELIEHGDTGLLTPIDESAPLVAAINQLLHQPGTAVDMATRARQRYDQGYSQSRIVGEYVAFLDSVAGRNRERRGRAR